MEKERRIINIVEDIVKHLLDLEELQIDNEKNTLSFVGNKKRKENYISIKYEIEALKLFKQENISEQTNLNGKITYENVNRIINNIIERDNRITSMFYYNYSIVYEKEFKEILKELNDVKSFFE